MANAIWQNCRFVVTFGVISAGASKRPDDGWIRVGGWLGDQRISIRAQFGWLDDDGWILMVILRIYIVDLRPGNHTKCHQLQVEIARFQLAIFRLGYRL